MSYTLLDFTFYCHIQLYRLFFIASGIKLTPSPGSNFVNQSSSFFMNFNLLQPV